MSENGPFSSFFHLRELEILNCPELKAVLPYMSSQQQQICLPHLNRIRVAHCEEVEEIFESNREFLSAQKNINPSVALPELLSLELEHLPKLRNIYSLQLHLCTSSQLIDIKDCAKLEGIVRSPTCDGDTAPIPCFRSLSELYLIRLPLLSSIYQMRLHHSTSLRSIVIRDCLKLEGIFTSCTADTKSILTFPKLRSLVLSGLPNLSSVYTGLLMFASLQSCGLKVYECPKLKMLLMSSCQLTCYASESTLASLPTESENPEWWDPLHKNFPDAVIRVSDYIRQARLSLLRHENDDHEDDKTNRVSWLSLSTS